MAISIKSNGGFIMKPKLIEHNGQTYLVRKEADGAIRSYPYKPMGKRLLEILDYCETTEAQQKATKRRGKFQIV